MEGKYYLDEPVEVQTRALENGTNENFITGYAAIYDKWSRPLVMQRNGKNIVFRERIAKGAFDGVDFNSTICSVNHDIKNKTIAKRSKGTLEVVLDEKGLKYVAKVPNTTQGRDAIEDVINGNLEGSSFMFHETGTFRSVWNFDANPIERTITKFENTIELGPVTLPAYEDSTAALRSYEEAIKETEPKIDYEGLKEKLAQFRNKK